MDIARFQNKGCDYFLLVALTFFKESCNITDTVPFAMITDGLDFYHIPLLLAYTESKHHTDSSFFDDVTNNIIQSF